jgi:hypothetical protein
METIMRPRDPGSDSYRSRIIDVEVTPPADAAGARDVAGDPPPPHHGQSFRERHALKVMGAVMVAMFATVIIAQVGC